MTSAGNTGVVIFIVIAVSLAAAGFIVFSSLPPGSGETNAISQDRLVLLPAPETDGTVSVEEALSGRRSVREYAGAPLEISDLSQLLWASQGVTGPAGLRAAPSAGALYPLEIYIACGNVNGLLPGVYQYLPETHSLNRILDHDVRDDLSAGALGQSPVRAAPAVIASPLITSGPRGSMVNGVSGMSTWKQVMQPRISICRHIRSGSARLLSAHLTIPV